MAKVHKTQVEILGETLTIRADEDPDYIVKIAKYVDKKAREITSKTATVSTAKTAMLVALNIADELFKTKELVRERISSITKNIDEVLKKRG
jgi:cell division protein ZapA